MVQFYLQRIVHSQYHYLNGVWALSLGYNLIYYNWQVTIDFDWLRFYHFRRVKWILFIRREQREQKDLFHSDEISQQNFNHSNDMSLVIGTHLTHLATWKCLIQWIKRSFKFHSENSIFYKKMRCAVLWCVVLLIQYRCAGVKTTKDSFFSLAFDYLCVTCEVAISLLVCVHVSGNDSMWIGVRLRSKNNHLWRSIRNFIRFCPFNLFYLILLLLLLFEQL